MKRALIFGIGGQDGSYLADVLLERGYVVHGTYRRSSVDNLQRIRHLRDQVALYQCDLTDHESLIRVLNNRYDEIYNEADQDHVWGSFQTPIYNATITYGSVAAILNTVKTGANEEAKFFQPCTAMMFGSAPAPQNEETPFDPQSPYAVAKTAAYYLCKHYRDCYAMHICTAFLYNHDSPRRTEEYLLHKICNAAVRISLGKQDYLKLGGDLDLVVDIGYAKEYMEAVNDLMQVDMPSDYVIASNHQCTIRQLVEEAFYQCKLIDPLRYVKDDPGFVRPGNPQKLVGDITKARKVFGYDPKWDHIALIKMLVKQAKLKYGAI